MFKMPNKQKAELRKIYLERADRLVKELAQTNKEIDRLGTTKKKSKTERRNKRLTKKYIWKLKCLEFGEDLKTLKSLGINLYFDETKDTGTWDLKKLVVPAPNKCTEQQILSEAVKHVLMLNYSHEVYLNWLREVNDEKLQITPREESALSYIAARVTDGAKFFNMEQVAELMHLMLFTQPEILQTEQYKRWEEIMCQQKKDETDGK
ncbi:MAG: hypothetical protein E7441_00935 [Ruminococcaceae bacterium]|nr:hypothetical protein [Oscillospiraceae bacterium]